MDIETTQQIFRDAISEADSMGEDAIYVGASDATILLNRITALESELAERKSMKEVAWGA